MGYKKRPVVRNKLEVNYTKKLFQFDHGNCDVSRIMWFDYIAINFKGYLRYKTIFCYKVAFDV